jgi:hypothetical protein
MRSTPSSYNLRFSSVSLVFATEILLSKMLSSIIVLALGLATATNAQTQYTATGTAAVAAARATAPTLSPTSYVKGKTFDRFVTIWFENTDYSVAAAACTFLSRYIYNSSKLLTYLSSSYIPMDCRSRHNLE